MYPRGNRKQCLTGNVFPWLLYKILSYLLFFTLGFYLKWSSARDFSFACWICTSISCLNHSSNSAFLEHDELLELILQWSVEVFPLQEMRPFWICWYSLVYHNHPLHWVHFWRQLLTTSNLHSASNTFLGGVSPSSWTLWLCGRKGATC